jgi:hypothetical protein
VTTKGFVSLQDFDWKEKDRVVIQPVVSRDGTGHSEVMTRTEEESHSRRVSTIFMIHIFSRKW